MLTAEENEILCRVGPGTPMGDLMRRYWQPIAASSELIEYPVKMVRILGETLVLYRDLQERLGLIGGYCPHRGYAMGSAIPDEEGLRCAYTGWLFDNQGNCVDMPFEPEDSTLKFDVRTAAYPVEELGGLIWAYMGPKPAPLLPRWDVFVWDNAYRQIGFTVLPCNWLQCMESAVDPADNELLGGEYYRDFRERQRARAAHGSEGAPAPIGGRTRMRTEFERNKYGIVQRCRAGSAAEDTAEWVEGHPLVFPIMVRLGTGFRNELQIRVPLDDTHTWNLFYQCFVPGPAVEVPKQESIPLFQIPLKDEKDEYLFDIPARRDMVLWCAQGEILDRTREHLAESDRGLVLYRRLLQQQVSIVEDGGDPINVFRDPAEMGVCVSLEQPIETEKGVTRAGFDVNELDENIDRYSPVIDEVKELYKRMEEVRAEEADEGLRTEA